MPQINAILGNHLGMTPALVGLEVTETGMTISATDPAKPEAPVFTLTFNGGDFLNLFGEAMEACQLRTLPN